MSFFRKARRQPSRHTELAELDQIAQQVSGRLSSGAPGTALDLARRELVPFALDCLARHDATVAAAPNVLWTCGEAALGGEQLDLTVHFWMRALQLAIVHDATEQPATPFPANDMLLRIFEAGKKQSDRLKPLADAPADRKIQMISELTWPYLRFATELHTSAADLMALLQRIDNTGVRLVALALADVTLDSEQFIPPHAVEGRLAAQETRFRLGVLLCEVEPRNYENADLHLRTGLTRLVEMERGSGAVDADRLTRALNALKHLLAGGGHFSPLLTLEMAFDGLQQFDNFTLEIPQDPIFQAGLKTRITLDGMVTGFSQRLGLVLDALDSNTPTRLDQIVGDQQ
ncbi:hypothetical protein [Pseudonocardia hierapolitana]|nr:hypothetical protein [Pseudonocardia hierapolitana]